MRHIGIFSLFSLISTGLWAVDSDRNINHHISFLGEFLYMGRCHSPNISLVKNPDKKPNPCKRCPTETVLSSKNLLQKMDWEPGYRVSALATPKEHFSLEAVFFYLQPWVGEKHVNGDAKLRLGFVPADYTEDYRDASLAKGRYHSQFWDAEFNYWRNYSPRLADYFAFSLIFGARYFHLNESLKLKFVRPPDSSDYKIHTYNHIYALQVGFDLQINPVDWLTWDIVAKVGPLATCGKQRTHLRDENNTVTLRHYEREKWQSGIFTDVSASMGFQIKDILNLHVGYEMLFLSGIALPPNQVFKEADAGKKVEVNGTAIIHGVFAGATLSF